MDQCDCDQTAWTGQSLAFLKGLETRLKKAKKVALIVSFIRESGVRLLVKALQEVTHLEILTGTYLQITEPWALRHLKEECPQAHIRLYNHSNYFVSSQSLDFLLRPSALCRGYHWLFQPISVCFNSRSGMELCFARKGHTSVCQTL